MAKRTIFYSWQSNLPKGTNYTLSPETTDRKETATTLTSVLRSELEAILTAAQEEGERLQLQFGDIDTKTPLGQRLQHSAVFYSFDPSAIPDYSYERDADPGGSRIGGMIVRTAENPDYLRQLAQYVQRSMATRKIGFVVYNGNRVPMNDLTMGLVITKAHGLVVLGEQSYAPAKSKMDSVIRSINPSHHISHAPVSSR